MGRVLSDLRVSGRESHTLSGPWGEDKTSSVFLRAPCVVFPKGVMVQTCAGSSVQGGEAQMSGQCQPTAGWSYVPSLLWHCSTMASFV